MVSERKIGDAIREHVKEMIRDAADPKDIWWLYDYLREKRQETDTKYDYKYSRLIFVFGRLFQQGWLLEVDLQGLSSDKINLIKSLADGLPSD